MAVRWRRPRRAWVLLWLASALFVASGGMLTLMTSRRIGLPVFLLGTLGIIVLGFWIVHSEMASSVADDRRRGRMVRMQIMFMVTTVIVAAVHLAVGLSIGFPQFAVFAPLAQLAFGAGAAFVWLPWTARRQERARSGGGRIRDRLDP